MKLTEKQKKFCEEYLVDLNATQAAIRAGYSQKTANRIGHENLTKPDIQSYVQEKQKQLQQRTGITIERVLNELASIAFSDVRKFYNEDGTLKKIIDLEEEASAALSALEVDELWEGYGEDRKQVGVTKKIKRWDKTRALEMIAKHLGMFPNKVELTGKDGKDLIPAPQKLSKDQIDKLIDKL